MLTLNDVLRARRLLAGHLPATPSWSYPLLDEAAGRSVVVKHENAQPTGAFKVRGALNLLAGLDAGQPVVTYSTGNHARSVAYAARTFGVPAHIVMPAGAAEFKVRAVRALGATVTLHGKDMSEAEAFAATLGGRLISPGDEPAVIAGVGTAYLELFERHPDLDTVVVPVGSGTGAAAACLVVAAVAPGCRVIGVQSTAAPAAHDSWRAGACVRRDNRTRVDGLATGRGFELPQSLLRERLADFVLVDDDAIDAARGALAGTAHTQAEGAGAAALAAVLARPDLMGSAVAVILTGGNATAAELATSRV
ncbi:pyridoxal-phosphate dependent enzyme [Dactylosporangium sp. NPDC049525]|uniref:threonine ammonia-lyase n=1 Tax=Dactylosporangium sp. NPDC049525 TaxID=3154730 RepID=UPI0034199B8B